MVRLHEQMLQIWLLYDFCFLVFAYIVAKPYVPMDPSLWTQERPLSVLILRGLLDRQIEVKVKSDQ